MPRLLPTLMPSDLELRRPSHRGEPDRSVLVCHPEHGHAVKVRLRAA